MSWRATADVKAITEGLSRSEKLVLLILADYHNEKTGQCNPPVRHIADDALMTPRRVQQILTALATEERGMIQIDGREGGRQTAQYWLKCIGSTPEKYSPLDFAPGAKPVSPQGRNKSAQDFTPGAKSLDVKYGEPKEEPSPQPKDEPKEEPPTAEQVQELLEGRPEIFKLYEQEVGLVMGDVGAKLIALTQTYPESWIPDAFAEAVKYDRRNVAYISAILARWASEGRHRKAKTPPADGSAKAQMLARYAAAGGR